MFAGHYRIGATLILFASFSSCSLMGLADFDASPCSSDDDCSTAKQRLEPSSCGNFLCREGLCIWEEGKERCNQKDDDCDGLIDQGVSVEAMTVAGPFTAPGPVAAGTNPARTKTFAAVGGEIARGFTIGEGGQVESQPAQLRYDASRASDGRCPTSTVLGTVGGTDCNFSELALAADDQHIVFATINSLGCGAGQVRIGMSSAADPFVIWLGKRDNATTTDESNIAAGVDLTDQHCTGKSRKPGPGLSSPTPGATRPAVASIDTNPGASGALAVWLGHGTTPEGASVTCGVNQPAPVEALGVFVPAEEQSWLNGTDNGTPLRLGVSTRLASPAVLGLAPGPPAKYLVAFPGSDADQPGLQLVIVQALRGHLNPVSLEPLSDGAIEQVVLAPGAIGADGPEVGVAWSSGCGSDGQLSFTLVAPLAESSQQREVLHIDAPYLTMRPQLLHATEGFSVAPPTGGWFLMWSESPPGSPIQLRLSRFTDGVPTELNRVTLSSGAIGYPVIVPHGDSGMGSLLLQETEGLIQTDRFLDWCADRG